MKKFDGVIVFESPIIITGDEKSNHNPITIYGILYNKDDVRKNDIWSLNLNYYIIYLMACQSAQLNGAKVEKDCIVTKNGHMIPFTTPVLTYIFNQIRKELIDYRIVESSHPLLVTPDEHRGDLITDKVFLIKYQLTNDATYKGIMRI